MNHSNEWHEFGSCMCKIRDNKNDIDMQSISMCSIKGLQFCECAQKSSNF